MQFGRTPHVHASTNRRATVRRWSTRLVAAIACLVGAQAASAQAALGVVTGRVTDLASGQPIAAVSVTLEGTTNGALTGDDGRYTLRQIAPGPHTLNFTRIGYEAGKLAITARDGAPTTGDLALKAAVMSLQAFVTTVTGPTRKIELGTTTAQINVADKIAELPVNSMGTLLSGRASGVQVLSSGAPGSGSRIRIRGQNSLSLSNDPLVYIDGVRVTTGGGGSTSTGTNNVAANRLDDLSPEEIESIEVVKGPSAATLYGTEAANGVINITTKRGKSGKTVWQFFTENGIVQDPVKGEYPTQYYRWGSTRNASTGAVSINQKCVLTDVANGTCIKQDSLTTNSILNADSTTFIDTGHRNNYGMQVSGGTDRVQFFLSGEAQDENGTYRMTDAEQARLKAERAVTSLPEWQTRPNTLSRVNLRGNLSATIATGLTAQLSTAYITSELNRPSNENSSTGLMVSALGGPGGNKYNKDSRGIPLYGGFTFPSGDILSQRSTQNLDRYINSLAVRWQALSWLSTRGTAGLDYTNVKSLTGQLLEEGPVGTGRTTGSIGQTRASTALYSLDMGATATWQISKRFQSKTSTGVQYFRTLNSNLAATANTLPPGRRDDQRRRQPSRHGRHGGDDHAWHVHRRVGRNQ